MNFQKCTISMSRLIHFHYLPIYLVIPLNSVLNYQGGRQFRPPHFTFDEIFVS